MRPLLKVKLLICLIGYCQLMTAQNMYPGAEGFGSQSRGAYAGEQLPQVIKVTNLNDAGPGSLRAAVNRQYPRIIVFEISGVIELERDLRLYSPYIHIAGQTAPYPGITLKNFSLGVSTHDVLVQGMKIRPGTSSEEQIDGINIADDPKKLYNIVIDHCSISWALDENIGILNGGDGITVSNCIISEGLSYMNHSMGLLAMDTKRVSVFKNLFIHNADRNPLVIGDCEEALIANNLIYNCDTHALYLGFRGEKGIAVNVAFMGNLYFPGQHNRNEYILSINKDFHKDGRVFLAHNKTSGFEMSNQWGNKMIFNPGNKNVKVDSNLVSMPSFSLIPINKLKAYIIINCGAQADHRDSVDLRLIQELKKQTGKRIRVPKEVGGWPKISNYRVLELPENIHVDADADGFTNIQEWLHTFI